jgi:hypothetical protein
MKAPEGDFLKDRRRALEDSFFAERDRQLLARLQNEMEKFEDERKLAHVSGILDKQVLQDLLDGGVRAETLTAVRLIPLVEVAWCDGNVSRAEREAVLKAAAQDGIQPGTACYDLLASWLERKPDPRIVNSWKDYVSALVRMIPQETSKKMRDDLLQRLTRVANAAGGFLGLQKISKDEQVKIEEFAKASEP